MKTIFFTENFSKSIYPVGENVQVAMDYIYEVTPHIKKLVGNHPINIWCSGSSGAILAAFLVKNLDNNCNICHVKKTGETAHHGNSFYNCANDREKRVNIILDDFMRSGETIERIYSKAKEYIPTIDILVLSNCYQENWKLSFVPKYLIIDKDSFHPSWSNLDITKEENKQNEALLVELLNF